MARVYRVTGNPTAVANAANTELLTGVTTSSGKLQITRIEIGQLTTETPTGIVVAITRFVSVTGNSGGTAITPAPVDSLDSAATSTWLQTNSTVMAGTATVMAYHIMQDVVGMQEIPLPDDGIQLNVSQGIQIKLVTALGAATNMTYVVTIREL
jgi:hypothetical protein